MTITERAPVVKASRCLAITTGSFLPIALRSTSAWPRLKPPSAWAMRITCS